MPLRVIRDLLDREDAEPERMRAMIELEDRILERALAGERELEPLVAEEVRVLTERLAGDLNPERALEIIEAGVGPLNDLIAALHTKPLVGRLAQHQAA